MLRNCLYLIVIWLALAVAAASQKMSASVITNRLVLEFSLNVDGGSEDPPRRMRGTNASL
jgi:hypothetical protein